MEIKRWKLAHLMHHNMGMQYKKVNDIAWTANSEQNLILRQRFVLEFLKIDLTKKTVYNTDETWLN